MSVKANGLFRLYIAVVLYVALIVGVIVAVTRWIPHAGSHGHAPSTLGYIALYCVLALVAPFFAALTAWLF
jgi:hypothetical protein